MAAPRFLLDEGLPPSIVRHADNSDLDVVSVYDLRRAGLTDWAQMELAAADGRVLVTRNRLDTLLSTAESFRLNQPHAGVLVVPWSLPNDRPQAIVRALQRWSYAHTHGATEFGRYHVDFLTP